MKNPCQIKKSLKSSFHCERPIRCFAYAAKEDIPEAMRRALEEIAGDTKGEPASVMLLGRHNLEYDWPVSMEGLEFDAKSEDARRILLVFLKDEDFDLICGGKYGLTPLSQEEKKYLKSLKEEVYPPHIEAEYPKWLFDKIGDPLLCNRLNDHASVDIRANFILPEELKNRLKSEGLFFSLTPYSPFGLRSAERINLNNCIAYKEGLFDVQDEACQTAAVLCNVKKSEKIIDYCAGAGGKSLTLGAILKNEGVIHCHDIDFNRMDVIKARAERLSVHNLKLIRKLEDFDYDCFILDAPCSGSGTFRRAPDAKFRLSKETIEALNKTQLEILETAYAHTKKGGRIIYMTCSVLKDENENIVEQFALKHQNIHFADHQNLWDKKIGVKYMFKTNKYIHFSPLTTSTDGFFFCMMKKN